MCEDKMDSKSRVILELLGEIHQICKKNDILYYPDDTDDYPYSMTIMMDAKGLLKFLEVYDGDTEHRVLEWKGNNNRISGDVVRYVNTDTLSVMPGRLARELYLGMFVTIRTTGLSGSLWRFVDRGRNHFGFAGTERRSAAMNKISAGVQKSMIRKTKGEIKKKSVTEITYDGISLYAKKDSLLARNPEAGLNKLIIRRPNDDEFICDETMSYREFDFSEERKVLASFEREISVARLKRNRGEEKRLECVYVSLASHCRYTLATDLLSKYSYEEIINGAGEAPIKGILKRYLSQAAKIRDNGGSAYIGDEFTAVINKLFPKVNTDELYKNTPDVYYEGIKVYDWKGDLIATYGGRK